MVSSVRQVNERITNLSIPTKVSELENDKGYLTEHQSLENYITEEHYANGMASQNTATNALIRQVNERIDGITVPTKVSELENDSGYLTEHQSLAEYAKKTEIPAPYTLPTASTSTLGGVKVDGNTITIADGVISAKSGGSSGGGGGSGEWHYTINFKESDLYNAKELVIFYQQTSTMKLFCDHFIFVKQDGTQGTLGADFSNQYFGMFYMPDTCLWDYNGSQLGVYNLSYKWKALAYKT